MDDKKNAKREIRFLVPQDYFDRVKGYADECGESVASFVRQIVYDRLTALDTVRLGKSTPDMMRMMEAMMSMDSDDGGKVAPVVLEVMKTIASDSDKGGVSED